MPIHLMLLLGMRTAMTRERQMAIKTLVRQGRYEVDAHRVAEAILLRMLDPARELPRAWEAQKECSKPSSSPVPSTNTAAG